MHLHAAGAADLQQQQQDHCEGLLAAIGQLTDLKHLELVEKHGTGLILPYGAEMPASYSNLAALTASSQLTALGLVACELPVQAWLSMLPQGRRLQQLRVLRIVGKVQEGVDGVAAAAIRRIAQCCPNPEVLFVPYIVCGEAVANGLTQLSSLTSLDIRRSCDELQAQAATAKVAAQLTGLRHLTLV